MKTKSTIKKLKEILIKENERFKVKDGNLKEVYSKFSKIGIDTKSEYTFPLKDTLGRTFEEHLRFTIDEKNR